MATSPLTPQVAALLADIEEQTARIRAGWDTWDIDTRHDATNELHTRAQDADEALMDAVRVTDFQTSTQALQQPASAS